MVVINQKLVKRWNSVMNDICCEHITINTRLSELESKKQYYGVEGGITTAWMIKEAKYWLSCYYESGHCRCDDRFEGPEAYKEWVSETGKLKRLINALQKTGNVLVVKW